VTSQNVETALRYLDASMRHDVAVAATFIGPGYSYTNHAQGIAARTVEELIAASVGDDSWTDRAFDVARVVETANGDTVVVQGTLTNVHPGSTWRGVAATGRRVTLDCCHILRFNEDGLIVAQEVYEDLLTVMEQLGVVEPIRSAD
jgi:predicted ester cyclase